MRTIFALLVAGAAPLSAQRGIDPRVSFPDHVGLPVVKVRAEVLSQTTAIGQPSFLTMSGSQLWVSDRKGDPFLHVLDTATGRIIRSIGRRGQGPEDFRQVLSVFPDVGNEPAVRVWDELRRLMRASTAAPQGVVPGFTTLANRRLTYVFPAGRGRFLGFNYSDTATFVFFDSTGAVLRTAAMPLPGADSIGRRERLMAFNGSHMCSKPDASGYAVTHAKYGRITLLDTNGAQTSNASVPYPSEAVFRVDATTGAVRSVETRSHYQGCAFSDEHLFALYCGKLPTASGGSASGHFVHVFDRRGALVRVLELSVDVDLITVDRTGRTLYGVSWNEAAVYKAAIPRM